MTRYLIVRHGSNAANQHMQAKKALGIIEAPSREAARAAAEERWIFYANQCCKVIPESRAPKGLWNEAIEHAALGGVL